MNCEECPKLSHVVSVLSNLLESIQSVGPLDPLPSVPMSDVVQEFVQVLVDNQLQLAFPISHYNQSIIEEKANYFFNNQDNIRNHRSYLSKIVLELKPMRNGKTESKKNESNFLDLEDERLKEEERRMIERRKILRPLIDKVTDSMLQNLFDKHDGFRLYCKSIESVRENEEKMFAAIMILQEDGVL
jgi:hypothetical protein